MGVGAGQSAPYFSILSTRFHVNPSPLLPVLLIVALLSSLPSAAAVNNDTQSQASGNRGPPRHWSPDSYPDPNRDTRACGRRGALSWVCDPDGVVSFNTANIVDRVLTEIRLGDPPFVRTRCNGATEGYKVALALMRHMAVPDPFTAGEAARDFAYALLKAWNVGGECGNGALLLMAVERGEVYIATGSSAGQVLTRRRVNDIIDNLQLMLDSRNYSAAAEDGAIAIGLSLAHPGTAISRGIWDVMVWCLILFMLFIFFQPCRATWKRHHDVEAVKRLLERLKEEQMHALRYNQYPTSTCPVCLEEFTLPRPPPGGHAGRGSSGGGTDVEAVVGGLAGSSASGFLAGSYDAKRGSGTSGAEEGLGSATAPLLGGDSKMRRSTSTLSMRSITFRKQRVPLMLPCSHVFCEDCIMTWVEQKNDCPICRKRLRSSNMVGGSAHNIAVAGNGPVAAASAVLVGMRDRTEPQDIADEVTFRIGSIHRRFPHIVDAGIASSLATQVLRGEALSWEPQGAPATAAQHTPPFGLRRGRSTNSLALSGGNSSGNAAASLFSSTASLPALLAAQQAGGGGGAPGTRYGVSAMRRCESSGVLGLPTSFEQARLLAANATHGSSSAAHASLLGGYPASARGSTSAYYGPSSAATAAYHGPHGVVHGMDQFRAAGGGIGGPSVMSASYFAPLHAAAFAGPGTAPTLSRALHNSRQHGSTQHLADGPAAMLPPQSGSVSIRQLQRGMPGSGDGNSGSFSDGMLTGSVRRSSNTSHGVYGSHGAPLG